MTTEKQIYSLLHQSARKSKSDKHDEQNDKIYLLLVIRGKSDVK